MSNEKTVRIQQAILPEALERLISEELAASVGGAKDFKLVATDLEGVVKVNVTDEVLMPFVAGGLIEIVRVGSLHGMESSWNEAKATYQLDQGNDIEDIF